MQNLAHSAELIYAYTAVKQHFRDARAAVAVDAFLYFEEGNNKAALGPDLLVTLDHELKGSKTYQTWVEGRLPDFILEVVSPSSVENDKKLKKEAYEQLGVREYFVYDPDGVDFEERVLGYQLDAGTRAYGDPLDVQPDGSVKSAVLNLSLRYEDSHLIIQNTETGEDYRPSEELRREIQQLRRARAADRAKAQAEARRRMRAEAAAQAEARRRMRAESEAQAEARRRMRAESEAQAEARRRRRAEAESEARAMENRRLQQQLAQLLERSSNR